jgi:hypothetical protein
VWQITVEHLCSTVLMTLILIILLFYSLSRSFLFRLCPDQDRNILLRKTKLQEFQDVTATELFSHELNLLSVFSKSTHVKKFVKCSEDQFVQPLGTQT